MACSSATMSSGCSLAVLIVFICAVVAVALGAIAQIIAASQTAAGTSLNGFSGSFGWMYVAGLVLGIAAIVTSFSCQYARCSKSECTCAGSAAAKKEEETEA